MSTRQSTFDQMLEREPVILIEGSLIERLRRDPEMRLDPHVEHAGFLFNAAGRAALEALYRTYLDLGRAFDLPMIICTPTWRASPDRLRLAGLPDCDRVCAESFSLLHGIRSSYGPYSERIVIGGLMGCRGDAYDPADALSQKESAAFHRTQIGALRRCGVDVVLAATLPALSEALGIAQAAADIQVPTVVSFVLRPTGTLLDGTPLGEAIARIDSAGQAPPGIMVNCVHPTGFAAGFAGQAVAFPALHGRVLGLQANTSRLTPEQLDELDHLDAGDAPEVFADAMLHAHRVSGIRILGGCCGTDERHIRCIAERLRARPAPPR